MPSNYAVRLNAYPNVQPFKLTRHVEIRSKAFVVAFMPAIWIVTLLPVLSLNHQPKHLT